MIRYKLKIELLSDMCCASGEGNGAEQDIKSGYDNMGLPIIYGRRLKGILRENAEFMKRYSYDGIDDDLINKVFGTEKNPGILKVGNAEIENYSEIKEELLHLDVNLESVVNPNSVEAVFTTNRFFTGINEWGIVEKHSLRVVGTIPRGNVFYANLCIESEDKDSPECRLVENVCKLLRGIGLNRNRGLGEVKCNLEECLENKGNVSLVLSGKDSNVIDYVIEPDSDIVSADDYISGSSIQGWFINELLKKALVSEKEIKDYLFNIRFSNAYVYDNKVRYLPMPLGFVMQKDESDFDKRAYSLADGAKVDSNDVYVNLRGYYNIEKNKIFNKNVSHNIEFHFSKKTKEIYKINSIGRGQRFKGSIYADTKYLEKIIDVINDNEGDIYLGASVNAQYAKSKFYCVKDYKNEDVFLDVKEEEEFVIEFLSDVILTDKRGINLSNKEVLKSSIRELIQGEIELCDIYTNIIPIGGYNAKWKLPKRRYTAFAKGTQIVVKLIGNTAELNKLRKHGFIGLLQNEGYGEYAVRYKYDKKDYRVLFNSEEEQDEAVPNLSNHIISSVVKRSVEEILSERARECVAEYYKKSNISSSTAMRMINAYKAAENFEYNNVEDREANLFLNEFKRYKEANFAGDNNEEIRKMSDYVLEEFQKCGEEREGHLPGIIRDEISKNQDSLFKLFLQTYIFYAKAHYREEG